MIAIIDYGMGNLGSVKRKLDLVNVESIITSSAKIISNSDKIILPGVGHFAKAMDEIRRRGLIEVLNEEVTSKGKPVLGICLGMQLLARHSDEGGVEGLGWIDAQVKRLIINDSLRFKIPHMGWNTLDKKKESSLLRDISTASEFYFVHSYHVCCNDPSDILTTTSYEMEFVSSLQRGNIFGTQFHPEKSHGSGERMLRNFLEN